MTKGKRGFQPGNKEGLSTRFTALNQPENRGRKIRILSLLKKECKLDIDTKILDEISREQLVDILKLVLGMDPRDSFVLNSKLSKDLKEIKAAVANGEEPKTVGKIAKICQLFVTLNTAIAKETAAGRSDTTRWIIEYLFGKAVQPIDGQLQTTTTQQLDLSSLSDDELIVYTQLLEKIDKSSKAGNNNN